MVVEVRKNEIIHPLIHSSNGSKGWNWIRLKPVVWSSIWVSHVGGRGQKASEHHLLLSFSMLTSMGWNQSSRFCSSPSSVFQASDFPALLLLSASYPADGVLALSRTPALLCSVTADVCSAGLDSSSFRGILS